MATTWPPERRAEVEEALRSSRTRADAAAKMGITTSSLDRACAKYGLRPEALLAWRPVRDSGTENGAAVSCAQTTREIANAHKTQPGVEVPAAPATADAPAWQGYRPRAGWSAPEAGRPAKVTPAETRRIVVIPDTHIPHHDRKAWATTLGIVKDAAPHAVVMVGDFISFASVSHHRKSKPDKSRMAAEYYEANLALDELEARVGNARIYYCEGNHERRPAKYVNDNEQFEGEDIFNVPVSLYIAPRPNGYHRDHPDLRERFTWLPLRQYIKRAWVSPWGVGYMHSAKAEARAAAGKHHAAYHAEVVAPRSGCRVIVFGHNHTFQMYRSAAGTEAWCAGFLGNFDGDDPDPDFDYDMGPNPWATGVTLQEVSGDAVSTMQIPIVNGRAVLSGRTVQAA